MTITCDIFQEQMMALVYDELDADFADTLRAHAAECPECAEATSRLLLTRRLAATLETLSPSPEMDAPILAMAKAYCSTAEDGSVILPDAQSPKTQQGNVRYLLPWLRTQLLKPAFATALAAGVVLFVIVFLGRSMSPEERSQNDIKSILEETPVEIATVPDTPPSTQDALVEQQPLGDSPLAKPAPASEKKKASPTASEAIASSSATRRSSASNRSMKREVVDDTPPFEAEPTPPRAPGVAPKLAKSAGINRDNKNAAGAPSFSSPPSSNKGMGAKPARRAKESPPPPTSTQSYLGGGTVDEMDDVAESDKQPPPAVSSDLERVLRPSDDFERGMNAFARGDCNEAISAFETAVQVRTLSPQNRGEALFRLGRCEKRQGRCSRALHWYDKIISDDPAHRKRPNALLEAAQCRRRLGQLDTARFLLLQLRRIPGWEAEAERQLDSFEDSP